MGENPGPVARRAFLYSFPGLRVDYYAEFKLLGDTGLDLSAQYLAQNFSSGNLFQGRETEAEGELFNRFAKELIVYNPELLQQAHLYLESDSSQGEMTGSSTFFNMTGTVGEEILPKLLEWQGMEQRLTTVQGLIKKCEAFAVPWLFGFMNTRSEKPMRLTLYIPNENLEDLMQTLKLLEAKAVLDKVQEIIKAISELNIFNYAVDLDIHPDGSIGDTIGLQLAPKATLVAQQLSLFRSPEYTKFIALLEKNQLSDERINLLTKCVWSGLAPDAMQAPYQMYSFISHFKLRWKGAVPMPAKVYLQMRTLKKQNSINDTLFIQ